MNIKPGYSLRKVLDSYLVMSTGRKTYMPNQIMSLNETGAFLWNLLEKGADMDELVARMAEEYEVSPEDAARDTEAFLTQLRAKALIDE